MCNIFIIYVLCASLFVGDMMPEKVLNLGHVPQLKNVQRIRLSPREKHLAATVKSDYSEELR